MIFLSIDPSSTSTGYSILNFEDDKYKIIAFGTIQTDNSISHTERFTYIFKSLNGIIDKYNPECIKMEDGFVGGSGNSKTHYFNAQSAMLIAKVRGLVELVAGLKEIPIYLYSPTSVKANIGKGNAKKIEVYKSLCIKYKDDELFKTIGKFRSTKTKKENKTEDIYDSLAVALMDIPNT